MKNLACCGRGRFLPGLLAGLLLFVLAACGDVPKPFGREAGGKGHDPFLFLAEGAGIHVEPVRGPVPRVGRAMAEAMAEALVAHDVVASNAARNRSSYILESQGYQQLYNSGPAELVMDWVLTTPSGEILGETSVTTIPPRAFWEQPEPSHYRRIAAATAPAVAAWLFPHPAPSAGSAPGGPEAEGGEAGEVALHVLPVTGDGGSGNVILHRTLLLLLQNRGIGIAGEAGAPEAGGLSLAGRIDIGPVDAQSDLVTVSWRLADAGNHEIGVIEQRNNVPAGSMEANWINAAPSIAEGAIEGLLPLLDAYGNRKAGRSGGRS